MGLFNPRQKFCSFKQFIIISGSNEQMTAHLNNVLCNKSILFNFVELHYNLKPRIISKKTI